MTQSNLKLQSFISESNDSLFSIHNLPYGVFSLTNRASLHVGVAIGNFILDLTLLEEKGFFKDVTSDYLFNSGNLNYFATCGQPIWRSIRGRIQELLSESCKELQNNESLCATVLVDRASAILSMPFRIGGFTDFYASIHHATNVGRLFRGEDNALLPNWKYLPVAYNGRASTVQLSGTNITRPSGQILPPNSTSPIYSPCKKLDFELELGVFVGSGNPDAMPIGVNQAREHLFGCVLVNDWSARDIQAFEYQPLGPFLAKSFATSISPWVVPFEALEPFFSPMPEQNPQPVNYLQQNNRQQLDIQLTVELIPAGSKTRTTLCTVSSKELYWSLEQLIAHHTVNNCILEPGDLIATGTISGEDRKSWGSMLELTFNGKESLLFADGIERQFLEDGDTVIFTGFCEHPYGKIGFGELRATILSANN